MKKIVLISASSLEHGGLESINGYPIYQVGIGKVNAAANLNSVINSYEPDLVINFGSCGNLKNIKIGEVVEVSKVYNDIDLRPIMPYGACLTLDIPVASKGVKCFTTDQIYDSSRNDYSSKYLEMINECDIVDMECFSLAYVCMQREINFRSFKWVSDDGDVNSWEENAAIGFNNFKEFLTNNINKIVLL